MVGDDQKVQAHTQRMAQMNKQVAGKAGERRTQLEKDLIGDELSAKSEVETGRRQVQEPSKFQQAATRDNRMLAISQGFRQRHPNRVLNQFDGVMSTTSAAAMTWEQALIHDTKRVEMPKEFRPSKDTDGMVNQVGVVTTALDNFKASKGKFSRMHLVNV